MKTSWLTLIFLTGLSLGCNEQFGTGQQNGERGGTAWGPADPMMTESPGRAAAPTPAPAPAATQAPVSAPAPMPAPAAAAPTSVPAPQAATVDATKKGIAGKEMGKGVLATPASMYMRIPDKVVFLNVQQAMNLYKGANGSLPKTHDDFMRDIIKANNLNLPELPDRQHYQYMPDKEELMIVSEQP